MIGQSIQQAAMVIQQAGVVVYPTEGVFGVGCDYQNESAVDKLLRLKQRSVKQGLILVASHIQQVLPLIKPADRTDLARALKTWPGHHTWVFPASDLTPSWITGDFDTVAVRVSNHAPVVSLCEAVGSALVSTSANIKGQETATHCHDIQTLWGSQIDYYLDMPLGGHNQASSIRIASNGKTLR